ncbi:hypothetical protein [Paraburkholderia sp. JHI869]|uniref:hypothetical protein n=1 Tax=Paraburkholderia sp. JHI869 TaxID=3112959 RepID=UPI00317A55F8
MRLLDYAGADAHLVAWLQVDAAPGKERPRAQLKFAPGRSVRDCANALMRALKPHLLATPPKQSLP